MDGSSSDASHTRACNCSEIAGEFGVVHDDAIGGAVEADHRVDMLLLAMDVKGGGAGDNGSSGAWKGIDGRSRGR